MPCGYKKNPELGIVPLVAAAAAPAAFKAAGKVGKALGGLFKKKKKKGAPAPAPAPKPAGAAPSAIGVRAASSPSERQPERHDKKPSAKRKAKGTAKKQLSTSDVVKALQTYKAQELAKKQANRDTLKATLGPTLNAITELTKKAAIQKQATNEHNRRMLEANRWLKVDQQHEQILAKIGQLEKALYADKANKARIFSIYGVHP